MSKILDTIGKCNSCGAYSDELVNGLCISCEDGENLMADRFSPIDIEFIYKCTRCDKIE